MAASDLCRVSPSCLVTASLLVTSTPSKQGRTSGSFLCSFKNIWTDPKESTFGTEVMLAWFIEFAARFYWNFKLSDFRQSHEPLWHWKLNLRKNAVLNVVSYYYVTTMSVTDDRLGFQNKIESWALKKQVAMVGVRKKISFPLLFLHACGLLWWKWAHFSVMLTEHLLKWSWWGTSPLTLQEQVMDISSDCVPKTREIASCLSSVTRIKRNAGEQLGYVPSGLLKKDVCCWKC